MSLKNVLVTGSNRGIGLEMIRQLIKGQTAMGRPENIFACCRDPKQARDLEKIANETKDEVKLHLVELEVSDDKQISDAVKFVESIVGDDGLNLLINNAAMLEREGSLLPSVTRANLMAHFDVNTVSPILVAQAFLPLLRLASSHATGDKLSVFRSSVINMSSGGGSIASVARNDNFKLGIGYSASKAALNMATKYFATELKDDNILFVGVSPGWVQTDMGTMQAELTPQESVSALFNAFAHFKEEHNGGFYTRAGKAIPF